MPLGPEKLDDDDVPRIGIDWYDYKGLGAAGAEIAASEWSADAAGVIIGSDSSFPLDSVNRTLRSSVDITALPSGAGTYQLTNKATFDTGEEYSLTVELQVSATL